jgi:NADH oxidase (H2O-forming)
MGEAQKMAPITLASNVFAVGVKDPGLAVFDIVIPTEFGTTYNAYLVRGTEKTALIESVKRPFAAEWLANIAKVAEVVKIDYIVINHSEPDHSGALVDLIAANPGVTVVLSRSAKTFVDNIVNGEYKSLVVGDNDTLPLGGKTLTFLNTPFLHWPDTMLTWLAEDGILFSCDFLGAHYSSAEYFDDEIKKPEDHWRAFEFYYGTIMRPFREHVLKAALRLKDMPIRMVATSHGPILRKDPQKFLARYEERASVLSRVTEKKVPVVYASSYGNTAAMAVKVAEGLKAGGVTPELFNIVETPMSTIIDAFEQAAGVLFGTPTLNGTVPHPILDLIGNLVVLNMKGKPASVFGSYGWSGEAVKAVSDILTAMRFKVAVEPIKVKMTPSESELAQCFEFGRQFAAAALATA